MNYGDLVSEKEYRALLKKEPNIQTITTATEQKAEEVYNERLWHNVAPGTKLMIFWKTPDIINEEHTMIWKRHFYKEIIIEE